VVLRILDRGSIVLDLQKLGFPNDTQEQWDQLIVKPYGMILVTGPTGSGKTTTLYGSLNNINSPDKKIITIEDPVEYQLNGVNQIHVKPIGLTFAVAALDRPSGSRRHHGRWIRDAETARRSPSRRDRPLVFSTLHQRRRRHYSAAAEMGVGDYLLASSLLGVLAHAARRICPDCRQPVEGLLTDHAELKASCPAGRTVPRR
jgi:general secretion pathway protein E